MLARAPVVPLGPTNKSFLLLFFKKEVLAFLPLENINPISLGPQG
jgi:hypothetical protein